MNSPSPSAYLASRYHKSKALYICRLLALSIIVMIHAASAGLLLAALALRSATLIEAITMGIDLVALISASLYFLHRVRCTDTAATIRRNLVIFVALFIASLANLIMFIVRMVEPEGNNLTQAFSAMQNPRVIAISMMTLAAVSVIFAVIGFIATLGGIRLMRSTANLRSSIQWDSTNYVNNIKKQEAQRKSPERHPVP